MGEISFTQFRRHAIEDSSPAPIRAIKRGNYGKPASNQASPARIRHAGKPTKDEGQNVAKTNTHARNGGQSTKVGESKHHKLSQNPDIMRTPTRPSVRIISDVVKGIAYLNAHFIVCYSTTTSDSS
jgi:hypothetical protein